MSNVEKMYGKNKNIPESLYKVRHSLAHVMAEAVLDFFPEAKPTIGPPIDTGFYYYDKTNINDPKIKAVLYE